MSAVPIQTGQIQFWDKTNGKPLSCGSVATYESGTGNSTRVPKDTWTDQAQTQLNNSLVNLDNNGQAYIFGVGFYDLVLINRCGVEVEVIENVGWLTDGAFPNAALPDLNVGT